MSTSSGSPGAVALDLDHRVRAHQLPGAFVAVELAGLAATGSGRAAPGSPAHRRRSRPRASRRHRTRRASRRYASAPTRGWSARPMHTAPTCAQPSRRRARRAGCARSPSPARARGTTITLRRDAGRDPVALVPTTSTTGRSPDSDRGVERPRDERAARAARAAASDAIACADEARAAPRREDRRPRSRSSAATASSARRIEHAREVLAVLRRRR